MWAQPIRFSERKSRDLIPRQLMHCHSSRPGEPHSDFDFEFSADRNKGRDRPVLIAGDAPQTNLLAPSDCKGGAVMRLAMWCDAGGPGSSIGCKVRRPT